jgi:hypothetical protein
MGHLGEHVDRLAGRSLFQRSTISLAVSTMMGAKRSIFD